MKFDAEYEEGFEGVFQVRSDAFEFNLILEYEHLFVFIDKLNQSSILDTSLNLTTKKRRNEQT